jgi:hypothetical protein
MSNYNILSDYEKQQKLKEVEAECQRLQQKSKYWILKQLGIPKSTYYDWLRSGGTTKSKAPKAVWNKTPETVEDKIVELRNDINLYKSERTPVGIANKLEEYGMYMTSVGVWGVLKRKGENRRFVEHKKQFIIYPRSEKFLEVVCIDDIMLTNFRPRDLAVFNAIDEFSQSLVAISFISHRVRKRDVIALIEQIKINLGRLPKIIRLDNAKAHISLAVKRYCKLNNIKLQFIDKGTPQQNWPVESFNGVIEKDLIETSLWKWDNLSDKQQLLNEYRDYYNNRKPLNSDPLKRTPNEIATAITSIRTQERLKFKLLRKHRGQTAAKQAILEKQAIFLPAFVRNVR